MKAYFLWLAKLLTLAAVLLVGVPLFFAILFAVLSQVAGKEGGGMAAGHKRKVAVVELNDIITSSREVVEQLHKQIADESVQGVVLRIDSPGGAVGPSQEIYSAVKRLKEKKPIVASMGTLAASGGLYAALGASKILAQPGTLTGSIGVILEIPNFTDAVQKVGVEVITIKSGKFKDAGNAFRKMTPEEAAFLENTVRLSHLDFIGAVSEGRKIEKSKVMQFADGRVLLGSQAKELGLIDGFGDVYDAARAVFELRGEPLKADEAPYLYYPADKYRELKRFLEALSRIPLLMQRRFRLDYLLPY